MPPLSFPSDPINGAVSGEYTYDATKTAWRKNAALPVSVTHSDVAPSNPREGDQWWKSNEGTLFTYYNDGTSSQWVESTNVVASSDPNPIPAGAMMAWASDVIPANWLLCDGSAVSRSTYASLFASIGTTYGTGDGTTTFNLPHLKGKTIVGKDSSQTEFDVLGETGGAKTHTLTASEMPSHTHTGTTSTDGAHTHTVSAKLYVNTSGMNELMGGAGSTSAAFNATNSAGSHSHTFTTSSAGSGGAHNNLQPYIVLNYIIKFSAGETPGDSQLAVRVGAVEAANNATPLSQNYIINGAMDIWQRGTSGLTGTGFQADRWYHITSVNPVATRSTIAPGTSGVPENISYSLDWSGGTVGTTGYNYLNQRIENVRTLAGKTATLSFYAKGSTPGTIAVSSVQSFGSGGSADSWITGSSISLTSSWQRYSATVAIPSLSGKTIGTAMESFLQVRFVKGLGSSYAPSLVGIPELVDYTGTISITGVQLEEGSYATPFRRNAPSLQAELAACQRYYWRKYSEGTYGILGVGNCLSAGVGVVIQCPVEMRAVPTAVETTGTMSNYLGNSYTGNNQGVTAIALDTTLMSKTSVAVIASLVSPTADKPFRLTGNNTTTAYLGFSAEL